MKLLWNRLRKLSSGRAVLALLIAFLLFAAVVIEYWDFIRVFSGTQAVTGALEPIPLPKVTVHGPPRDGPVDWQCWRGPRGDGASGQTGIITDWSNGLRKLWVVDYLCRGATAATWSAPVVRGDRLVVPGRDDDNDLLFCLDAATGGLLWRTYYPAKPGTTHGTGPRATPYIDDDRVYTFGRAGDVVCWRLDDGAKVWHRSVADDGGEAPTWGHSSSPLVVAGLVIVQGGGAARVVAYDKMTGELRWTSGEGPAGYAALARASAGGVDAVLAFHGTGIVGLEIATGRELWNAEWKTYQGVNATTPVVDRDTVFVTSRFSKGGALFRFDASQITQVWETASIAAHHTDPFIIDGHIYGYSGMSAQNGGDFTCVALDTGEEKWSTGEMGHGTCVFVDGYLICADIEGNLFLSRPDPERHVKVTGLDRALGEIDGPVWTVPVVANGRLYLRFKQRLVCYALAEACGAVGCVVRTAAVGVRGASR